MDFHPRSGARGEEDCFQERKRYQSEAQGRTSGLDSSDDGMFFSIFRIFGSWMPVQKQIGFPAVRLVSRIIGFVSLSALVLGTEIELHVLPLESFPKDAVPALPWIGDGENVRTAGVKIFAVRSDEVVHATGWGAVTGAALLIGVDVHEPMHRNDRRGGDIWDGSCVQLSVDGLGQGAPDADPHTSHIGTHDLEVVFALTENGVESWVHQHGSRPEGARSASYATIVRDEENAVTRYNIKLPWEEMGLNAGAGTEIGLRLMVSGTGVSGQRVPIPWPEGSRRSQPSSFARFWLRPPPSDYADVFFQKTRFWEPSDKAVASVVMGSGAAQQVNQLSVAVNGHMIQTVHLPSGATESPDGRRLSVELRMPEGVAGGTEIQLALGPSGGLPIAEARAELSQGPRSIEALMVRLDSLLLDREANPLFREHVRSVRALVAAEWNRAQLELGLSPQRADSILDPVHTLLEGLDQDADEAESYLVEGRRSLVLAFISDWDQSLQYYTLSLPKNWDPERAYPLIVNLHGAGPAHPLFYVWIHFVQIDKGEGEDSSDLEPHIVLSPWGRGNTGYSGPAEWDVFQALAHAAERVRLDPDRYSLVGHSMGGGGVWSIAHRSPHLWASACSEAGGIWNVPNGLDLSRNVAHLPFRIWHGEADGAVPVSHAFAMRDALRAVGNEAELVIVPDQGHDVPREAALENRRWLLQHRRTVPSEFEFVSDLEWHRGIRGIWMRRELAMHATPSFTCRIESSTVYIDSEGTPGLTVDLGKNGLAMTGEVEVIWNGEIVYKGPPAEVDLGSGGGRNPRLKGR